MSSTGEEFAVRRWKVRFLLLGFLCGVLYFTEQRFNFFRLRSLEITPPGVVADSVVWQAIPKSAEAFWLSLVFSREGFAKKIEGFLPVEVRVRIRGWGRYRISLSPLETFLYVSWRSRMWLLSTNGRMWLANLPSSARVKGLATPKEPILVWDEALALPIDPEGQEGDIYPSSLPVAKITKWYDMIKKIGWHDDVYCLIAKKIDGKPVVQLLFGSENGVTGEVILQEGTTNWMSLAKALSELYPDAKHKIPPGLVVNATFSDMKFTVTDRNKQ